MVFTHKELQQQKQIMEILIFRIACCFHALCGRGVRHEKRLLACPDMYVREKSHEAMFFLTCKSRTYQKSKHNARQYTNTTSRASLHNQLLFFTQNTCAMRNLPTSQMSSTVIYNLKHWRAATQTWNTSFSVRLKYSEVKMKIPNKRIHSTKGSFTSWEKTHKAVGNDSLQLTDGDGRNGSWDWKESRSRVFQVRNLYQDLPQVQSCTRRFKQAFLSRCWCLLESLYLVFVQWYLWFGPSMSWSRFSDDFLQETEVTALKVTRTFTPYTNETNSKYHTPSQMNNEASDDTSLRNVSLHFHF